MKNKLEYANLRIAHGKDRCANPPRSGPQGASGARRSASGHGPSSAEPISAVGEDESGELGGVSEAVFLGGDDGEHKGDIIVGINGNGVNGHVEGQDMHVDTVETATGVVGPA